LEDQAAKTVFLKGNRRRWVEKKDGIVGGKSKQKGAKENAKGKYALKKKTREHWSM